MKVTTFALSAAYAGVAGSLSVMVTGAADATNPLIYFQLLDRVPDRRRDRRRRPPSSARCSARPSWCSSSEQTTDLIEGKEILAPAVLGGALILIVFVLPGRDRRRLSAAVRRTRSVAGRRAARPPPLGPTNATHHP